MGKIGKPRSLLETDDRFNFDCGEEALNNWFSRNSWKNHRDSITRTTVLPVDDSSEVVGYVSLCASEMRRDFLPKAYQRNQPQTIPCFLLAQLAVNLNYQGQGCGVSLLQYAFRTAIEANIQLGASCLITHPLNENARVFYKRWGFRDCPGDPRQSMAIRIKDLQKSVQTTIS